MSDEKNNAQLGAGAAAAGAANAAASSADGGKKDVLLSVEHLHKAYGDHVVLDDISLEVKRGEVIVIIGPSGCGKSTFLRCLNALEPIQGGSVKVAGKSVDADERGLVELRQKVGMVFQSYDLFPHMTVLDNITLAPMKARGVAREEAEAQARALLERVGLADKASSYPRQLSGGQKQRVAIARALAMEPELLLLDEVTAAPRWSARSSTSSSTSRARARPWSSSRTRCSSHAPWLTACSSSTAAASSSRTSPSASLPTRRPSARSGS